MSNIQPQVCQLSHPGFRMLGEPVFQLSEGQRVPSMVVQLDNQRAVLPLRAVAREFAISPESPDGMMLTMIEQALEFVVGLRLGDAFPSELNSGEASWKPSEQDQRIASGRVRRELVRCVFARIGRDYTIQSGTEPGWDELPANRPLISEAVTTAAGQLDTTAEEMEARVGAICEELACIETIRRLAARGIAAMQDKMLRIKAADVAAARRDTLHQVQALARRGLKQIGTRFDEVDMRLDDMLAMLKDSRESIDWFRRQRNWLFRVERAWRPCFTDWAATSGHVDEFMWRVVERTYAFLAPRFMSYKEWTANGTMPVQQKLRGQVW